MQTEARSADLVPGFFQMAFLAARTAPWAGEALAILEDVAAHEAPKRVDHQPFTLACGRPGHVRQMGGHFPFREVKGLRKFADRAPAFFQQRGHASP